MDYLVSVLFHDDMYCKRFMMKNSRGPVGGLDWSSDGQYVAKRYLSHSAHTQSC